VAERKPLTLEDEAGLIREYLPKGTEIPGNMSCLQSIANSLNDRPHAMLHRLRPPSPSHRAAVLVIARRPSWESLISGLIRTDSGACHSPVFRDGRLGGAVTRSSPIGSVVIPAHNEARVIDRCLSGLLAGFAPGELDVVVSCNACTDGTEDIVQSLWPAVRVVETAIASKAAALRAGEKVLRTSPRLFLDADVTLPGASARTVIERLHAGPALAARPPVSYDTSGADPLVRSYYRARIRVPSVMNSLWGAGVYGLSAAGRARFGDFPDVIGDDLFVDRQFITSEIEIVESAPVLVRVPRRTADLLCVLRRTYQGNWQNQGLTDRQDGTAPSTARGLIAAAKAQPGVGRDVAVYLAVAAIARLALAVSPPAKWSRDESSREGANDTPDNSEFPKASESNRKVP
jgi:hypothetical protein